MLTQNSTSVTGDITTYLFYILFFVREFKCENGIINMVREIIEY